MLLKIYINHKYIIPDKGKNRSFNEFKTFIEKFIFSKEDFLNEDYIFIIFF